MKTRNDFVSNSSSSSFICMPEDACKIALFNKSKRLSLHEYLLHFGEQDLLPYLWYETKVPPKMRFVDNDEFCKMFAAGIGYVLPKSAKEAYAMYPKEWNKLMPFVEEALMPAWGNKTFEYYEAEDCSYFIDEDGNDINEESYLYSRFNKHKMKFLRIFNNH